MRPIVCNISNSGHLKSTHSLRVFEWFGNAMRKCVGCAQEESVVYCFWRFIIQKDLKSLYSKGHFVQLKWKWNLRCCNFHISSIVDSDAKTMPFLFFSFEGSFFHFCSRRMRNDCWLGSIWYSFTRKSFIVSYTQELFSWWEFGGNSANIRSVRLLKNIFDFFIKFLCQFINETETFERAWSLMITMSSFAWLHSIDSIHFISAFLFVC